MYNPEQYKKIIGDLLYRQRCLERVVKNIIQNPPGGGDLDGAILKDGSIAMESALYMGNNPIKDISAIVGTEFEYELFPSSDIVNGEVQIDMSIFNSHYGGIDINSVVRYRDRLNINGVWYTTNSMSSDGLLYIDGSINIPLADIDNITAYNSAEINPIAVQGDLWMNNHKISGLLEPDSQNDAATKGYVDEKIPTGTDRDILTWTLTGDPVAKPIGWRQLSDLPSPPPFLNGVYIGTAFQSDGSALFGFLELAIESPNSLAKPNAVPVYQAGTIGTGGGTLPVQNGLEPLDAVNLRQLNQRTPILPNGQILIGRITGNEAIAPNPRDLGQNPSNNTSNDNNFIATFNPSTNIYTGVIFNTSAAVGGTIMRRTGTGTTNIAPATQPTEAVPLAQMQSAFSGLDLTALPSYDVTKHQRLTHNLGVFQWVNEA